MSCSVHANNRTKSIKQRLDDKILTPEKMYSINFIVSRRKFCFSLHYNGAICLLMVHKFKAKDSKIVANPLCFRNISDDFFAANMEKTGLYGSVFDFNVDYRITAVDMDLFLILVLITELLQLMIY